MSLSTKVDFIKDRFDPFTEIYSPNNISDEQRTIPSSSPFYIRTKETIKEDSPSSIEIWTGAGKTGDQYTEVSSTPGPGEFQVDYKFQSGYIRFNEANGNTGIYVTYKGLGDVIQAAHINTVQNVLNLDKVVGAHSAAEQVYKSGVDGYLPEVVDTGSLKNLIVTAIKLGTNSVETAKIKNANVTLAKLKFSTGSYSEDILGTSDGTPFVTNKYAHQIEVKGESEAVQQLGASIPVTTSWGAFKYQMRNGFGSARFAYAQWSYHSASKQTIWGIWDKDQKKLTCVLVEEDEGYYKLFPELKPNQILVKFKDPNKFLRDEYAPDIDKVKDQANKDKKRKEKGRAGYILEDVEVKIEDLNEIPK